VDPIGLCVNCGAAFYASEIGSTSICSAKCEGEFLAYLYEGEVMSNER